MALNGPAAPALHARWQLALARAACVDWPRLRRLLAQARGPRDTVPARTAAAAALREFRRLLKLSADRIAQRAQWQPRLDLPPELPLAAHRDALLATLAAHQVSIVCGATGSGKSTQLPKLCMALGRGLTGRIGLTQPRRLAARAIASRIALETGTTLGQGVGFQTRFEQVVSPATRLKVMTDGILLQEIHHDRQLLAYDTIVIDEVHERSVNIDLLLGYLRNLLPRRPELKLILTSATIEAERFQAFFPGAALLEVPGRSHAIDLRYRPPDTAEEGDLNQTLLRVIEELDAEARGDVLVFLPGEREILEAREFLRAARLPGTEVLPLYARLAQPEQQKIFTPHQARHVVLATNVAETSLTVPGVRHVIDSGLVRISTYSPRSKLQRLPIVPNSQASADQRKGRCGRERAGICVRLYAEEEFASRPAHTAPELQRSNLAAVILRLADLALPALDRFPLLDPPGQRAINDGYSLLRELGALDDAQRITPLGRRLARLPLDPRLARIVVAAEPAGCLQEALVITAGLSAGDIREWPREQRGEAEAAHAATADRKSEFRWLLTTWETLTQAFAERSRRQQASFCRERFWSWRRAREWQAVYGQLKEAALRLGMRSNEAPADYRAVHQTLLVGFAGNIGRREEGLRYLGARNLRFRLHPASAVREKPPRWLLAAEITETTAALARLAAAIEPDWVVAAVPHLVKRTHSAPDYDPERGRVLVREEQSLQGLVLAVDSRVDFATIAPEAAREVFVCEALVDARLGAMPRFLAHNLQLLEEIAGWEARTRRPDLHADRERLAAFYLARLPATVASRKAMMRWLESGRHHDRQLRMGWEHATRDQLGPLQKHLFPASLSVPAGELPLTYSFAPAQDDDGVTVTIPLPVLAALRPEDFERLVPGLLRDKVFALLKALPKERRRVVSPLNEFATALSSALEDVPGPLGACLSQLVQRLTGSLVPEEAWQSERLPAHLQMRFIVVDDEGTTLAAGRDLGALQASQVKATALAFRAAAWSASGESRGGWCFGELPERTTTRVNGILLEGFPALVPVAGAVKLEMQADAASALRCHRAGVARLLTLTATAETRALRRELAAETRMALAAPRFGWSQPLADWLIDEAFGDCLGNALPRSQTDFEQLLASVRGPVTPALRALVKSFSALFARGVALAGRIETAGERLPASARLDLRAQLDELLGPAGLAASDGAMRRHCERYLRGMEIRLERLLQDPAKDARKFDAIAAVVSAGSEACRDLSRPEAAQLRYFLQELRVASFAPELRTAEPVSAARVAQLIVICRGA